MFEDLAKQIHNLPIARLWIGCLHTHIIAIAVAAQSAGTNSVIVTGRKVHSLRLAKCLPAGCSYARWSLLCNV